MGPRALFAALVASEAFTAMPACLEAAPLPRVALVQPSGAAAPANLLRVSITFTAPVDGEVLPRLALRRADGTLLQEPFLQQELWSPNGRILTILMHPGRVKTGLQAREELGAILTDGDALTLTLDGAPIKHWTVEADDTHGPNAAGWTLSRVHAGSRAPLTVSLDAPIDGRDAGYLAVLDATGRPLPGHARLQDGERKWIFIPQHPWRAGRHQLAISGGLEDPAGNRLGSQFETPLNSTHGPAADATLHFSVAAH